MEGGEQSELRKGGVKRIWKDYFEELYKMDMQDQVLDHMCGFGGIQGGNYFGGEPIRRIEVEARVRKLKNGKAAGKDEITGELIKVGDMVGDWIWRVSNIAFESGVVPEE